MVTWKRLHSESYHFGTCRHTLQVLPMPNNFGGLSSVCAKLGPASSKNNEILEINFLRKFTPHALLQTSSQFFQELLESLRGIFPSITKQIVRIFSKRFYSDLFAKFSTHFLSKFSEITVKLQVNCQSAFMTTYAPIL